MTPFLPLITKELNRCLFSVLTVAALLVKLVDKAHAQSGSGVSSQCVKIIMQDQFLQK